MRVPCPQESNVSCAVDNHPLFARVSGLAERSASPQQIVRDHTGLSYHYVFSDDDGSDLVYELTNVEHPVPRMPHDVMQKMNWYLNRLDIVKTDHLSDCIYGHPELRPLQYWAKRLAL